MVASHHYAKRRAISGGNGVIHEVSRCHVKPRNHVFCRNCDPYGSIGSRYKTVQRAGSICRMRCVVRRELLCRWIEFQQEIAVKCSNPDVTLSIAGNLHQSVVVALSREIADRACSRIEPTEAA